MWSRWSHREGVPISSVKLPGPTADGQAVGGQEPSCPISQPRSSQQAPPTYQVDELPDHHQLIGPNNEDVIEIDGESYLALIDSGSQITTITEDLWRNHPKLQNLQLESADVSIEGANGQKVPYLGVIPVSFVILDILYEDVPTFVVPSDKYRSRVPVLIGTNVIRASRRDQIISRGIHYLQQVKDKHLA